MGHMLQILIQLSCFCHVVGNLLSICLSFLHLGTHSALTFFQHSPHMRQVQEIYISLSSNRCHAADILFIS
eukprot:3412352-Amphidinium_carterae.1